MTIRGQCSSTDRAFLSFDRNMDHRAPSVMVYMVRGTIGG